jgi:MFS transporter, VNT family, synaptic vesicle glycoprotein 2
MTEQRHRRSMSRPLAEIPRSLDDYLEAAASAPPTLGSLCVHRRKRRNPPLRSSVFLRYSNGGAESNASPASSDGVMVASSSEHDSSVWNQYPWRYWLMYFCLGIANSSDASEILCLSYVLSVDRFDATILHHTAWRGGLLAATVFMGMLLGGLIVGAAGDGALGRQPLLVMGLAVNSLAGLVSAAATNVFVLSACRFVAGLGIGATVPPLFSLCSELAPPSSRGFWVTYVASFWMVGSIYVAIVGWIILGQAEKNTADDDGFGWWRLFVAACAVPSCVGCILVHALVPESPRFLLLQGRHDEALSVAHRLSKHLQYMGPLLTRDELVYHYPVDEVGGHRSISSEYLEGSFHDVSEGSESEGNDSPSHRRESSLVRPFSMEGTNGTSMMESGVEYQRRNIRLLRRASVTLSTSRTALWSAVHDFSASTSKLYTPQMRSTTWPLQMVWFSLSFGSYGLMTWINTLFVQVHLENVYFNALLFAASNLPGNILAALLMDKVGRARLLTGSILAASLSLVAFAFVAAHQVSDGDTSDGNNANPHATTISASWIVFAACSFQCFTIASWAAIDVLTSELFPTSIRSTGMGVCTATGRIGAMMAQFVNGALVSSPVRLLLTAAGALFIGAVTPIFLPADQSGRPVQDYTADSMEANHIRLSRIIVTPAGNDETIVEKLEGSNDLDEVEVPSVNRNGFLPHRGQEYTRLPLSGGKAGVTLSV